MRYRTRKSLAFQCVLLFICGSALAQTEPRDDPSRFLEYPGVREAIEQQTPLTSVALQPYGPYYLVDVKINGRGPFKFVIDSGTPSTIVDSALVQELGLSAEGAKLRVEIDSLTLGTASFDGVDAKVLDLDELWGDGSPSGIFGFDLLVTEVAVEYCASI